MSNEVPYWIVVSDEGPGTPPRRHTSYQSARDESLRLSKLHPDLNFGVFQYIGHAFTPGSVSQFYAVEAPKIVEKPVVEYRYRYYGLPSWGITYEGRFCPLDSKTSAELAALSEHPEGFVGAPISECPLAPVTAVGQSPVYWYQPLY